MSILLILFFTSFFGIIIMIGRKLVLLQNGQTLERKEISFKIPHLEKIKHLTVKNMKKYGHMSLVTTLRFYVRSMNLLKNKYEETKIKIKNFNTRKDSNGNGAEKVEVSKFLKMISEYKHKIRAIKQKIHEEENSS
ncbi:hypothetical protein A3F19_02135 [Candidatus Nomurabacteria bacterium RIFCSPHIGHO2_12_FULL_37_29]|uniref:Uncharacterized protein n=1 Tax=Candidatus Nomurabacteria bacterium RIFCSPHIGHO2_12_FULL_37_29 TaxID=1801759 RepID=A0A1F6WC78_9BACT|nr:MAG: hypothetical protein A3F19_02135 [Candidatus Nomurabacteria bacterium RIFCSPHIGHO2_12_FULL_37_29]